MIFDHKWRRDRFLGAIRQGLGINAACRAAGAHRQQKYEYLKKHPEWQEEIDLAEAEGCEEIECVLRKKCLEGNMTAIVFYLLNRSNGRWADKRTPTNVILPQPKQESVEELRAKLEASLNLNEDNAIVKPNNYEEQ